MPRANVVLLNGCSSFPRPRWLRRRPLGAEPRVPGAVGARADQSTTGIIRAAGDPGAAAHAGCGSAFLGRWATVGQEHPHEVEVRPSGDTIVVHDRLQFPNGQWFEGDDPVIQVTADGTLE